MSKTKVKRIYQCQECGAEAPQYVGRCTECGAWNSLEEKVQEPPRAEGAKSTAQRLGLDREITPALLRDIQLSDAMYRYPSGFPELDRVLGGGFLPGGYFLFGGDPGIGKSTLMLQVAQKVAEQGKTVLYIAGEESPSQIKMRSERLGVAGERILIYPETNILRVIDEIKTSRPDMVVVDSIQSVYNPDLSGTPGSVGQIKDCAGELMGIAKALGVTILLVGHVTKEGAVSGPRLLEHTVDGVLYFEGDKFRSLRILRSVKNRFGSTNEIGIFEMCAEGLTEVANPSELFLSENSYQNHPGSAIVVTMEGNRPILVELQALVGLSTYASPRRVANGVDLSRLHQIVAVLERRLGLDFSKQDIYVNVVGGIKIQEPAADLAIALAIVTSSHQVSIVPKTVIAGEMGLTGEIRPVSGMDARIAEGHKLGFQNIVVPKTRKPTDAVSVPGIRQIPIGSLMEALRYCLDQNPALPQDHHKTQSDTEEISCL